MITLKTPLIGTATSVTHSITQTVLSAVTKTILSAVIYTVLSFVTQTVLLDSSVSSTHACFI